MKIAGDVLCSLPSCFERTRVLQCEARPDGRAYRQPDLMEVLFIVTRRAAKSPGQISTEARTFAHQPGRNQRDVRRVYCNQSYHSYLNGCKPTVISPISAPVERRFHMPIFLWKFKPPKNMKRWSLLSHGSLPALLTATSGSPLARISQIRHDGDCSTLLHDMQLLRLSRPPVQSAHSCGLWMYRCAFVRTSRSCAFHAFLAVCDWGCAA